MKQTRYLTTLAFLMGSILLTACGGRSHSSHTPIPVPNNPAATPKNDATPQDPIGQYVSDDGTLHTTNIKDINTLVINGKTFSLATIEKSNKNHNEQFNLDLITHPLTSAKVGHLKDNQTQQRHWFYQGNQTPIDKLPSGVVNYEGTGLILGEDGQVKVTGNVALTADFNAKTLKGKIHSAEIYVPPKKGDMTAPRNHLNIEATITGNTFKGEYEGTNVNGAFYGEAAKEVAGTYQNNSLKLKGAFGASKK